MAQLGNLLVNGVARFINNVSCNGSITAPTFIGKLQGKADSATKDGNNNIINDYYAKKELYNDNTINLGRKKDTTIGNFSSAMGYDCTASGIRSHAEGRQAAAAGENSHAEGNSTVAEGPSSHAEGESTQAIGENSHSEGKFTIAVGKESHAEGFNTQAIGENSHSEGKDTKAKGTAAHAEGEGTTAYIECQHVEGKYNSLDNVGKYVHIVGWGTSIADRKNIYTLTTDGEVYAASSTINSGADYAEYFEWTDENPNSEDRVGYFVSFDSNNPQKIRIANAFDDYILGIVSGSPSVIGNGDEDWQKRYILDSFGRRIKEPYEIERKIPKGWDDKNNKYIYETTIEKGIKWKENPEYDSTKEYVHRANRKEWAAIGMLGVLAVRDDGSCEINKYCKCGANGIATKSEKGENTYRVIDRISDNIIKVVFR